MQSNGAFGILIAVSLLLALIPSRAAAGEATPRPPLFRTSLRYAISSPYYPVVLTGERLPSLKGTPIGRIALYALRDGAWSPIPFQIDRRDDRGRFQIPVSDRDRKAEAAQTLDANDECAFLAGDLGEEEAEAPDLPGLSAVTEIRLIDPETGAAGWAYALVFLQAPPPAEGRDEIAYDPGQDAVRSPTYEMAFSRKRPFLADRLRWKRQDGPGYGPDLVDTMKVRHRGRILHSLRFLRTQADSTSRILAVKDGPVRVIRKTVNRVRILWRLKTPVIEIDYICYPNAFFMDMRIHIPFHIGWFFSDVDTLMTIDGNDDPTLPPVRVFSRSFPRGLEIDGRMSPAERSFNTAGDQDFLIAGAGGTIAVALDVAPDFPIRHQAYLMDARDRADPPEEIPGQFGNGGFLTTRWEDLGKSVYRMMLKVYLLRGTDVEGGFRILRHSPSFLGEVRGQKKPGP